MKRPAALVEYLVFAAPNWLTIPMAGLGLMWLVANKSSWHKIPWTVAFMLLTLAGLWALTRIARRRFRGELAIGAFEAFFLLGGLAACLAPAVEFFLVQLPASPRPVEQDRYVFPLLFAWPAPIYAHWLGSGHASRASALSPK